MGKWSDGEQYDIEREGAREESDEVKRITKFVTTLRQKH